MKDNRLFWKTFKFFFSNEGDPGSNIELVKDNECYKMIKKLLTNYILSLKMQFQI